MLKLLHCADLHLDTPFCSRNAEQSEVRRRELRETFTSLLQYVKREEIALVLMAGDLFDSTTVTRDTADFVAESFATVPSCRFVIAPGNHDPYTEGGIYARTEFPSNVYIFTEPTWQSFSFPELNVTVYGYAFVKPQMEACPFVGRIPDSTETINLLCAHGDVGNPLSPYCPISLKDIAASGLDYIALGHVHYSEGLKKEGQTAYAYSGCLTGRDFGETGHKGALLIEIEKERGLADVKATGLRFSRRRYEDAELDVSGAADNTVLQEKIRALLTERGYGADTLLRITLRGSVSPSLRPQVRVLKEAFESRLFYLEIEDATLPLLDADALENDPTIKGAFYKELRPRLEGGTPEERALASKALRIGLAALYGEDFSEIE